MSFINECGNVIKSRSLLALLLLAGTFSDNRYGIIGDATSTQYSLLISIE